MKIMVCGSMSFAKEMMGAKEKLERLGHLVLVPVDLQSHVNDPSLVDNLDSNYNHALEKNVMKKCFDLIAKSDAILVLNYDKNGVRGYIGTSSLMEIGLAYYLGKKIFLLRSVPKAKDARWAHEIRIMRPATIGGDFKAIG